MHLTLHDFEAMDKIRRLNIINSMTGIKPANLIGSRSGQGITNLAIFSSVVHLGSNPPLIGMILRPQGEVRRHTAENIEETGFYTINHVHHNHTRAAHYTSAKWENGISEFGQCGFTEEYIDGFDAPFVAESNVKAGLQLEEMIPIKANGTTLVIGKILHLIASDHAFDQNGHLNLEASGSAGISGLNSYYRLTHQAIYPYARTDDFKQMKS